MQITERELLDLKDRLMDHAVLIEKFGYFAGICQNQQLRQILNRHQSMLQNHYNSLRSVLQEAQTTQPQQQQQQQQQYAGMTAQPGYSQ